MYQAQRLAPRGRIGIIRQSRENRMRLKKLPSHFFSSPACRLLLLGYEIQQSLRLGEDYEQWSPPAY